jgi:hypothetical protein
MESRIKKLYIDEATLNDGTTVSDLVKALIFLNENDYGKVTIILDLVKWIKTRAIHNDSDLIPIPDIIEMLDIYCIKYQFKLSRTIERKIEQSLRDAASKSELRLSQIVRIGQLLSFGTEGSTSFWEFYEECIVNQIESLTDHQFLIVHQTLRDRKRRSLNTWETFEREVEKRIPHMESSYIIKFLTFYAENRENRLWGAFCDRIMVLNDFSPEEVFQILQSYHLGDRVIIKIWSHLMKHYLINRSYIL